VRTVGIMRDSCEEEGGQHIPMKRTDSEPEPSFITRLNQANARASHRGYEALRELLPKDKCVLRQVRGN